MVRVSSLIDSHVISALKDGGIAVLRTDTLYGVVASASIEAAVEKIFQLKGRDDHKPPIVLISSKQQMFDVTDEVHQQLADNYWPGRVSIIMPTVNAPAWITRGSGSVAYRMPDDGELRALLQQVGPIIAPSANIQGRQPAMTIDQAIGYFGDAVDVYVDGGTVVDSQPSKLLQINSLGQAEWLR